MVTGKGKEGHGSKMSPLGNKNDELVQGSLQMGQHQQLLHSQSMFQHPHHGLMLAQDSQFFPMQDNEALLRQQDGQAQSIVSNPFLISHPQNQGQISLDLALRRA